MDNVTCGVCDPQCKESCYGAGPDKCHECKNVLDEKHCVDECPESKYNNSGVCSSCHATCIGCKGPQDTISEDGCISCHRTVINTDNHVERCLARNDSCPGGCQKGSLTWVNCNLISLFSPQMVSTNGTRNPEKDR